MFLSGNVFVVIKFTSASNPFMPNHRQEICHDTLYIRSINQTSNPSEIGAFFSINTITNYNPQVIEKIISVGNLHNTIFLLRQIYGSFSKNVQWFYPCRLVHGNYLINIQNLCFLICFGLKMGKNIWNHNIYMVKKSPW